MQGVRLGEIVKFMERFAPPGLAESWDRCGLQVGDVGSVVHRVLVALDPSPAAVEDAVLRRADLLLTHHPLFLHPLASLDLSTPVGRRMGDLLRSGVALYAAHTNLDKARGGVSDCLAESLGFFSVRPFGTGEGLRKIAVTVPLGYENTVRDAMTAAGAGRLGAYEGCSFGCRGMGTFLPTAGAAPFIGRPGQSERVEEVRLEVLVPESRVSDVREACLQAHPYEQAALDVYALEGGSGGETLGRAGDLPEPMALRAFAEWAAERLGAPGARMVGSGDKMIRRAAVCGGSGGDLWKAARAAGADVFLTGEVRYHTAQDAADAGFCLVEVGHDVSERVVLDRLAERLGRWAEETGVAVEVGVHREDGPYHWMIGRGA